jgi:hypothetical protein
MPIAMLLHADGVGEYKQMHLLVETTFFMLSCVSCDVDQIRWQLSRQNTSGSLLGGGG